MSSDKNVQKKEPEKNPADKEQNRQTYNLAVSIRSKRQLELSRTEYDLPKPYAEETPFLSFYRSMCEERHKTPDSDGNWGNWHSCLKYLEIYADEKTTFKDINRIRAYFKVFRKIQSSPISIS